MKKSNESTTMFFVVLMLLGGCSANTAQNEAMLPASIPQQAESDPIYNQDKLYLVALVYIKPGMEAQFEKYKEKARPIVRRHGGHFERLIQPTMLAKGDLKLPSEIHIAYFDNPAGFETLSADHEYQKLVPLREAALENAIFFPSRVSDFEFKREVGDSTKSFGVALINYKEGAQYKSQFAAYHQKACEIMPEFGAHFERFLDPVKVIGDLKKPDEIHVFYFDSPEGLKQMGSDPRMQQLFPLRDEALSELNFVIGKAL